MEKQFHCLFTVFVLAGTLFLAGCSADSPYNDTVDKTALNVKIAEAQKEFNNTTVSSLGTGVPQGKFWVTSEELKNTFQTAITGAERVRNNSSSSQTQVNDATRKLNTALNIFKYERNSGSAVLLGVITGTITLTGITNPPPKVEINARGRNFSSITWSSFDSQIDISRVNGTSATVDWSIPVYEDNSFVPGETYFRLWVTSSGSTRFIQVDIPGSKTINSPDDDVGSLGSVNVGFITLSGTINASYGGNRVSSVEIRAYTKQSEWLGFTSPNLSGANAPWSMTIPAPSAPTEIYFSITGYSSNDDWFYKDITPNPPIIVSNQNISGISLSIAIQTITLSGTINLSYDGDPAPQVEIAARTRQDNWFLGSTMLNSPDANAPWSITMLALDTPEEIYFEISGFSNDMDYLFRKDFHPDPPISVSNQAISGISLNMTIPTITLSGTINLSYDGNPVPQVRINIYGYNDQGDIIIASASLSSPEANALWSITILAPSAPTEIGFTITGFNDDESYLLSEYYSFDPPIIVVNQDIPGISLDVGDIPNPNKPVNPTPLSANTWVNGSITSSAVNAVDWYSIQVDVGQTYYIWWNDSDNSGNDYLDIRVAVSYSNGYPIFLKNTPNDDWFNATATDTVYVRVFPFISGDTGIYGIAYSTTNSRPTE